MSLIEGNTAFHARLANGAARGGLLLSLLAVIVGPFTATSAGPRHVLLLHSYGREFAPFNAFSESFRMELARQFREPLDFRDVNLEAARFEGEVTEEPLAAYLQSVFEGRHLDLLVPVGGPATRFAQRHRNRLFPETPMLIAGTRLVIGLLANLAKRRQAENVMRELGGSLLSAQEEERARS